MISSGSEQTFNLLSNEINIQINKFKEINKNEFVSVALFINDKLKKESVIATKAACQASGHLGKMPIFFFLFGVDYLSDWKLILPLVIAVYAGTNIGKQMLGKLPEHVFQTLFKIALTLIAFRLIMISLW